MNFRGTRPEVGKKTASRHEVLARAAADRAERAAARERDAAAILLQSWHRGYAAASQARATQVRAFDARLQGIARLKQQLPPGTQLPLPPLCLLAQSLGFVLSGRGSSRMNHGRLILASGGALTGAAAVKLRATLSLLLPALSSGANISDAQHLDMNASSAERKAAEAAAGVPRTLGRIAILAVCLLTAETVSHGGEREHSADSALAEVYGGVGKDNETSSEEEEGCSAKFQDNMSATKMSTSPAAVASGNSAASEGKWNGDLPTAFILALIPRLGPRAQQQLLAQLHCPSVAVGARPGSSSGPRIRSSATAGRPSLLRATVAAMADIVRIASGSHSNGSSRGGSASSHRSHPPLEDILSSVLRRRLGDLFLLSCTVLIYPRTDTTNNASSPSGVPEIYPPALAWADAVLCLHPQLVVLAAPFGFLAAAGHATNRCPWLWPALEHVSWPAIAEDSRQPNPAGLLHSLASGQKPTATTAAAGAAGRGNTDATLLTSSPLEDVFAVRSRRLRVRRVHNARDLAVAVATARVVNVAATNSAGHVGQQETVGAGKNALAFDEREATATKLLGEALLSRAQLCMQRGHSAAAWHDCCRALDLTTVVTVTPEPRADSVDNDPEDDEGTGRGGAAAAAAEAAAAERLAQIRRVVGLRRALLPLAVSARRLRAQVLAPFVEAGSSPEAAAARLADLRAAAAVPASVVGRDVRQACRLELQVAEAVQAEKDKAARKVATKSNRQAQAIAREAKKAGQLEAGDSSSSSGSEDDDDEDTKAKAEAKRVRRKAKRERAAERERARAAEEKTAHMAARASAKAAHDAQRASQDALLLANAQRRAQEEADALAAAQVAHRLTSMRVGEAESLSAADAAKAKADAAAALEAEAKRKELESAARASARAAGEKANAARAQEEAAAAKRKALAEQQGREVAAQRRKDRRAAAAAAKVAAAATAASEASAAGGAAGVSPPVPPPVGLSQASLGDRWWGAVEDDDPISMEPIAELKYPPFNLKELPEDEEESNAQDGPGGSGAGGGSQSVVNGSRIENREGSKSGGSSGSDVKFWFDGRLLAHWLVSTGIFLHPTTRQPVSRRTCARLDAYLARHRLVKQPAVVKMFDLCAPNQSTSSGAVSSGETDRATNAGDNGDRERRRLAITTREALRRDASRLLEQFFADGDDAMEGNSRVHSGESPGGGLVDDDEGDTSLADESAAAARRAHARSQRFLLHSTLDFPALPVTAPRNLAPPSSQPASEAEPMVLAPSVSAVGAGAAANAVPLYVNLTHWLDAADLHASGGVRALESALAAFAPGAACALIPVSLWRTLSSMFPRRYSLATPDAAERFLVVDGDVIVPQGGSSAGGGDTAACGFNGGGCPQVLDHLKHFASKVVTNDATGRCNRILLAESAPALRDANAAFIACRTQPYFLAAGAAFVLL